MELPASPPQPGMAACARNRARQPRGQSPWVLPPAPDQAPQPRQRNPDTPGNALARHCSAERGARTAVAARANPPAATCKPARRNLQTRSPHSRAQQPDAERTQSGHRAEAIIRSPRRPPVRVYDERAERDLGGSGWGEEDREGPGEAGMTGRAGRGREAGRPGAPGGQEKILRGSNLGGGVWTGEAPEQPLQSRSALQWPSHPLCSSRSALDTAACTWRATCHARPAPLDPTRSHSIPIGLTWFQSVPLGSTWFRSVPHGSGSGSAARASGKRI